LLAFSGISAVVGFMVGLDIITLAIIIVSIILGVVIAYFIGENSILSGAAAGFVSGMAVIGVYLLYAIIVGAVSFIWSNMNMLLFALLMGAMIFLSAIYSIGVYAVGKWVKQ
jgi:hypothetical protein